MPGARASCIALRVRGDSMNLIAPDNSIIVVDYADKDLRDGAYYIVKSGDDATFKRYRANPARFEPQSSLLFETIYPTGPVEIVGRVTKVISDL